MRTFRLLKKARARKNEQNEEIKYLKRKKWREKEKERKRTKFRKEWKSKKTFSFRTFSLNNDWFLLIFCLIFFFLSRSIYFVVYRPLVLLFWCTHKTLHSEIIYHWFLLQTIRLVFCLVCHQACNLLYFTLIFFVCLLRFIRARPDQTILSDRIEEQKGDEVNRKMNAQHMEIICDFQNFRELISKMKKKKEWNGDSTIEVIILQFWMWTDVQPKI